MRFFDRFLKPPEKTTLAGRSYKCGNCGNPVFFRNSVCLKCNSALGYEPHLARVVSLIPIPGTDEWRVREKVNGESLAYRMCANLNTPAACNWLLSDHGIGAEQGLCIACRLNRTIPDLSVPENGVLWGRFEDAKRRMVSTLLALEIPVQSKDENPERGLAFDFLRSPKDGPRVLTGHDNGLITMNIEEADASIREGIRENLKEPYRTLLGHFRHEVGHYYWDRLIPDTGWLDEFRRLFGDESVDYGESLAKNYKEGPPADWQQRFVSSYASCHPWEDWAETWAHLLHMADTLATAWSFGLDPRQLDLAIVPFPKEALYQPDEPNADRFLGFLNSWIALSAVMNEMSRGMGSTDFYPFALPRLAVAKLHFITVVIRAEREKYAKKASLQRKGIDDASSFAARIQRFAPTALTANTAGLTPGDRQALGKIISAAKYLDPLYRRQIWSGSEALMKLLEADTTATGRERFHYFRMNQGPWSRLDENRVFIDGAPPRLPQANFYPSDITKEEFNEWLKDLPADEKERATGYFHVIRRDAAGKLRSVPYSEEYREFLEPAAKLLREAAQLTTNNTLKSFLNKRAEAFASNDYYASDVAWMDLDAPIDVTIGPYETYADEMFGYKATYEAYVTLRDEVETGKLERFSSYLQELEDHLPMDAIYRNPKLGAASPIRVVNEVYSAGEGNCGVQTAAFNLPNDERVVNEKGSKRIMLKNVQDAKFHKTLVPISRVVLDPAQRSRLSFEAFFTHILTHELMHGLGPHNITVNGQATTVRLQLKELYSAIEEAKADITGLWALQFLIDKGVVDAQMEESLYVTYLASVFRSVRFGINEAHGRGMALQFNFLTDEGAFRVDKETGKFSVDESKVKAAVGKLTREILTIEAEGSFEKAKVILDKYSVIRPAMKSALDRLNDVPVDIEPIFPLGAAGAEAASV